MLPYKIFALSWFAIAIALSSCGRKPKEETSVVPPGDEAPAIGTVYRSQANAPGAGAMYPRIIQLKHVKGEEGTLLVTFEHYMNREPSFPIYKSADEGKTWTLLSEIEDTQNHWGMRFQPHLFELPQQVGEFPAGTIFASGNSIPKDMSATDLLVYVSRDGGKSWEFLSSIIKGGRAIYPNKGETPVWEPFLALDREGKLVAYYSDERYENKKLDQILSHKISEDGGRTWGKETFDVAVDDGKTRPGMAVVTPLPNGKYFMVFELVGVDGIPIHYKISDDGVHWGDAADLGKPVANKEGHFLRSTPYVVWTKYGGANGTIIASSLATSINGKMVGNGYMINKNLGEGEWEHIDGPIKYATGEEGPPAGYSQTMIPLMSDTTGRTILQLVPIPNGNKGNMDIKCAVFQLP